MALHLVVLPNEYVPVGTYVEDGEDGLMEKVRVRQENGRLQVGSFYGIGIPAELLRPYTFKILKRGFDDVGAHATFKRPHSGRF